MYVVVMYRRSLIYGGYMREVIYILLLYTGVLYTGGGYVYGGCIHEVVVYMVVIRRK